MSEPAAAESGRVRLGVASVALGAVGFGLLPVFLEYLRADGVDSGSSLVARFVGSAIPLALWVFIRRPAWRGVGLALVAGVGIGGGTIFLFEGYARLPASIAILVFYTYPVFTLALARAVFGTPIERRMLAAIAMVVLAAGLILSPGSIEPGLLPVVLATFGAPLGYGVYLACLGRIPAAVDPALRALVLTMSAGVVAGLYALAVEGGTHMAGQRHGVGVAGLHDVRDRRRRDRADRDRRGARRQRARGGGGFQRTRHGADRRLVGVRRSRPRPGGRRRGAHVRGHRGEPASRGARAARKLSRTVLKTPSNMAGVRRPVFVLSREQ